MRTRVTGPATPAAWPSLREWLRVSRDDALGLFPQDCFSQLWSEHRILGQKIAVVCDPDAITEILGARSASFNLTRMHLRMLTPALRRGVIVAEGDQWRLHRRAAMKVVANRHLTPFGPPMATKIEALARKWIANDGARNVVDDLAAIALEALAFRLFRHEGPIADEALIETIRKHRQSMEAIDWLDIAGAPLWLQSGRMRKGRSMVSPYFDRIDEALQSSEEYTSPTGIERDDAQDLVTNLMVGFESIAATCSWFLALAGALPEFARWLRSEGSSASALAPRVSLALLEVLRLYPPLPFIFRQALVDVALSGRIVRKGTIVCISPFIVHRHKQLWDDPDSFDPDRMRVLPKDNRFMPFSLGARRCVGRDVGRQICADILVGLLGRLQPVLDNGIPVPRAGLSLRPRAPLSLRIESLVR